jgi:YbbR-like protein
VVWKNWTRNAGAKILSFVIAVGVWLTVTNRIEFERTLVFPVEYVNRPADLTPIEPLPETVRVRVRGKGKFLRYTLRDGVCRVDLSGYGIGRSQLVFSGEDVVLPDDTTARVEMLEPRRAVVEFDETVVRDIAITPTVVGTPDARYTQVGKIFINPPKARVKGPRRLVDGIALLATKDIDIGQKKSTIRKQVRLLEPDSETIEVTPTIVDVGITIEPIIVERIEGITLEPVIDAAPPGSVVFQPSSASVEIEGARSIVEVAVKEVESLPLHAKQAWAPGNYRLRFVEFRDREVVLRLQRRLEPLPPEVPPGDGAEPPAAGTADTAVAAAAVDTVAAPPSGPRYEEEGVEIVGRLPLPRDVDLLALIPEEFFVEVLTPEEIVARNTPADSTQ